MSVRVCFSMDFGAITGEAGNGKEKQSKGVHEAIFRSKRN